MRVFELVWLLVFGIREQLVTVEEKVLVTIGLFGMLLVIGWAARFTYIRVDSRAYSRVINVAIGLVLVGLAGGIGTVLLWIWEISITSIVTNPFQVATRGVLTIILLAGVYILTGITKRFVDEFSGGQTAITQHQTELVFRSTQVLLYLLVAIIIFGIWDINLGGLIVGAGFVGIVVGLAARQTLGSLIAGFVLMFSRPFEIGDWVVIGDREGIVTEISIVNTRIQTFDGEYAMVPNDLVSSSEIINRTRKGRLRITVDVSVDYDTDLEVAMATAKESMSEVDDILSVPQPQVVVREFGNSSIILELRFWIDKPSSRRRWRARTAVISSVKAAFDREDIKIPFPQRELSGREETGGFKVASEEPLPEVRPEPHPAPNGGDSNDA